VFLQAVSRSLSAKAEADTGGEYQPEWSGGMLSAVFSAAWHLAGELLSVWGLRRD
jgi:hypothetical protein